MSRRTIDSYMERLRYELVSEGCKIRSRDDSFQVGCKQSMQGKASVWLEHRIHEGEE